MRSNSIFMTVTCYQNTVQPEHTYSINFQMHQQEGRRVSDPVPIQTRRQPKTTRADPVQKRSLDFERAKVRASSSLARAPPQAVAGPGVVPLPVGRGVQIQVLRRRERRRRQGNK